MCREDEHPRGDSSSFDLRDGNRGIAPQITQTA
jgi:hypothetical protein